jgi:type IV secretory pathway VirB9-like protein
MKYRAALIVIFAFASVAAARGALAGEAVALPSRFEGTGGVSAETPPADDVSKMVEEWMSATGALGAGGVRPVRSYIPGGVKREFVYGVTPAEIQCKAGMITDIELEPGERVENFSVTDGRKWSVSAAWSGFLEDITTHVLVRTNFPGLKSTLTILTDRRNYSIYLSSSLDGLHMPRVGFRHLAAPKEPLPYEKSIPPGKYRDLLETYGLVEKSDAERDDAALNSVDAAKLNFSYSITATSDNKKNSIVWKPMSVYDAGGKTYFVMPKTKDGAPARPRLHVKRNGAWLNTPYKILENGLFVMEGVFDEAMMRLGGRGIIIKRR